MKLSVRVPASIANMGPGFDVFAIAIREPYETVTVTTTHSESLEIEIVSKGKYLVPTDARKNTAGIAALNYLSSVSAQGKVVIEISKGIRPSGGMGSSGASAVGALYALNMEYGLCDANTLIAMAASGEIVSSGTVHHDNVSASMLGGFVINDGSNFTKIDGITIPIAIAVPSIEVRTVESRGAIGESIPVSEMGRHISLSSFLLHAFIKGDLRSIGRFVNSENVVEKRRARLIKGYEEVKAVAIKNGAYGVSISGSGPSVFAISPESEVQTVAECMAEAFISNGTNAEAIATESTGMGAMVVP